MKPLPFARANTNNSTAMAAPAYFEEANRIDELFVSSVFKWLGNENTSRGFRA